MGRTRAALLPAAAWRQVSKRGLRPEDVALVLRRLGEAFPHLEFSRWQVTEADAGSEVAVDRVGVTSRTLRCHIPVAGLGVSVRVGSPAGPVPRRDAVILRDLAVEARQVLETPSRVRGTLTDFGSLAFSRAVARLLKPPLGWEMVSDTLRALQVLASQTYEDRRIPFGVILTSHAAAGHGLSFESKRLKALTDGFSTALLLDREGGLAGIIALDSARETVRSGLGRPWWFGPLADSAARAGGVGIALTRGGDLLIAHRREMVASQRSGRWMLWRHTELLDRIRQSWHTRGRGDQLGQVIAAVYRVALELVTRRSGGLLVVASTRDGGRKLVASRGDLLGSTRRIAEERRLDASLAGQLVHRADRRIMADLASVDGALIVDRSGRLIAFGAMVKSSSSSVTQGARSRAAVAASRRGLAMKVSSDGGISVYRHGRLVLSL